MKFLRENDAMFGDQCLLLKKRFVDNRPSQLIGDDVAVNSKFGNKKCKQEVGTKLTRGVVIVN